ncbi:MAG: hypothetical protein JNG88_15485, partial [Phycisphaerales bacterium]|nr:hypothetical protein [Phycisphaerales bacterium]
AVFGRFNQNNGNYDGPGGANDGVNWLDGRTLRFNTDTINNIPPVATGFPANNTRTVSAGDLMFEQVQFLSPEPGQTTQLFITDLDGAAAHGCVINTSSGNVATGSFLWNTTCDDVGSYRFSLRAVDNFNPPGVTILQLTINVTQPTGLPTVELTDPQPFECSCNPISFSGSAYDLPDSEGRFDSYELQYATNPNGPWTTFDTGTTHVTNGVLGSWDTTNISQGYYFVRLIARKECGPDASVVSLVFVDKQFDTIDLRSPQSGNILGGIVCFDGTVTDGNSGGCFDNYTIRYATPPNYNNYQPVDPANPEYNTPIQNDPLGSWNTASGPTAVPDGTYRVQVTGTDNCGHSRNVRRDIIIDNTAPVAVITSLVNCDSVSGIVEIRGTATDAHLAGWTLQYAGGDSNTWVTIASGNTNVVNGVLANWNTNGLPKCAYALRLIASDLAGVNCSGYTHQTEFVVTVENGIRGDMNCDGLVNNFDINPFVLCLSSGECGCQ